MLLFHLLLLVASTCWSVSGQGDIPTVPCYGQDCSVTQSTTESTTELTPKSTTESTTTTFNTTSTTSTPSPELNQRTVVFILKTTQPGQDMFIRGGIDDVIVRPSCKGDSNAETSDCAISIQVNSLGVGAPWEKYDAWRVGDTKLDWFGAQAGQGTYNGAPAYGTPMAWTTNNPDKPEYQPLNKWGDSHWMVDFTMDCSETENGWFDLKAYLTNFGWETDITQSACTGTGADVQPPYSGTRNHVARCGYINRFNFGSGGCEINAF